MKKLICLIFLLYTAFVHHGKASPHVPLTTKKNLFLINVKCLSKSSEVSNQKSGEIPNSKRKKRVKAKFHEFSLNFDTEIVFFYSKDQPVFFSYNSSPFSHHFYDDKRGPPFPQFIF
jgi:hypothetical protein